MNKNLSKFGKLQFNNFSFSLLTKLSTDQLLNFLFSLFGYFELVRYQLNFITFFPCYVSTFILKSYCIIKQFVFYLGKNCVLGVGGRGVSIKNIFFLQLLGRFYFFFIRNSVVWLRPFLESIFSNFGVESRREMLNFNALVVYSFLSYFKIEGNLFDTTFLVLVEKFELFKRTLECLSGYVNNRSNLYLSCSFFKKFLKLFVLLSNNFKMSYLDFSSYFINSYSAITVSSLSWLYRFDDPLSTFKISDAYKRYLPNTIIFETLTEEKINMFVYIKQAFFFSNIWQQNLKILGFLKSVINLLRFVSF